MKKTKKRKTKAWTKIRQLEFEVMCLKKSLDDHKRHRVELEYKLDLFSSVLDRILPLAPIKIEAKGQLGHLS